MFNNIGRHVTSAYHSKALQDYCMKKHSWSPATFNSIYWEGIGHARRCGTRTQLMHTSKLMHGWLPVNHIVGHYSGITQCPGCCELDETINHLLYCPHPALSQAGTDSMVSLRQFFIVHTSEVLGRFPGLPSIVSRWHNSVH